MTTRRRTAAGCSAISCRPVIRGRPATSRSSGPCIPRGDKREQWVTAESRTAAIFLVSGRFRVDLPDRSVVLDRPGAYVVFAGVGHSWEAEEDSTILGVRWPSVPGY